MKKPEHGCSVVVTDCYGRKSKVSRVHHSCTTFCYGQIYPLKNFQQVFNLKGSFSKYLSSC